MVVFLLLTYCNLFSYEISIIVFIFLCVGVLVSYHRKRYAFVFTYIISQAHPGEYGWMSTCLTSFISYSFQQAIVMYDLFAMSYDIILIPLHGILRMHVLVTVRTYMYICIHMYILTTVCTYARYSIEENVWVSSLI